MNVKLSKEQKIKILNSTDVFKVMQQVLLRENSIDRDKKHFWIVGLSSHNNILYIELISIGQLTTAFAEPMQPFRVAILKRTSGIILVHNHPNGKLSPSMEDIEVTEQIIQAGIVLKIPVLDHLVISTDSFLSFAQLGILDSLNTRADWLRNKKEQQQIREEAAKKQTIAIARGMKYKGIAVGTIAELTGLSAKEIEHL